MSDSIFRELFVEVPLAILEARATWRFIETYRQVDDSYTVLAVRLACGHRGIFRLDETMIVAAPPVEIIDYVVETLQGEPRRKCTCVEYVAPPPCTAGVCK